MTKKAKETVTASVGLIFKRELINKLHIDGVLTGEELKDKKIVAKKTQNYISKNKENFDIVILTDHREHILETAKDLIEKGNSELAISMYAIFIEHTLNKIIQIQCSYKNIDSKTQKEIIKNVNIIGKCTWLFNLLELPQIKPEYVKLILKIAEERNSYIHYKWNPEPDQEESTNQDKSQKLKKIKDLIKYLKNYDTKNQYRGKKNRIENAIRKGN